MREARPIDLFLLVLLALIWGSAFFNIKIATYTYDTFTLVFVRVFFATVPLVLWCFYKKIKIMAFSKDWKIYAIVGLVNISLPFLLIAYGTDKVQSYLSAILMSSTPLSGTILAHFFTSNEKFNLTNEKNLPRKPLSASPSRRTDTFKSHDVRRAKDLAELRRRPSIDSHQARHRFLHGSLQRQPPHQAF